MTHTCTIGADYDFVWTPPGGAIVDTAADVVLTVYWPGGTQTYDLALDRASDTVSAVSDDRRRLTVTYAAAPAAFGSVPEPAVLSDGAQAQIPVSITRHEVIGALSGYVHLAAALPMRVALSAGADLHYVRRTVKLDAAHIGNAPVKAVRWRVTYNPTVNGVAGQESYQSGLLVVARIPFGTGLTDQDVSRYWPSLGAVAAGLPGWESARELALADLRDRIIASGVLRGASVDQLSGTQFRRVHGLLTARHVLLDRHIAGRDQTAALDRLDADIEVALKAALSSLLWLDSDGDGTVDTSETQVAGYVSVSSCGTSDLSMVDIDDGDEPVTLTRGSMGDDR